MSLFDPWHLIFDQSRTTGYLKGGAIIPPNSGLVGCGSIVHNRADNVNIQLILHCYLREFILCFLGSHPGRVT